MMAKEVTRAQMLVSVPSLLDSLVLCLHEMKWSVLSLLRCTIYRS